MRFNRDDIDSVRLEPSVLGGWVIHLVDYDGRTVFFQRHNSYEAACSTLSCFGLRPPPQRLDA